MSHSKPVLAIRHHLQKYVKRLLSDIKEIEAKETESKKVVASLANLLEQRECVARVLVLCPDITSQFPDVQSRLLVKISAEKDSKLENPRECVAKVDVLCPAIASQFPDIQSQLLVKISAEVDRKLEKLRNITDPLKKHHDVVYKTRTAALNLIRKHPDDLDLHTLATGEPTVPPLMVMIDWVDTIERQMREIYYIRMYYLENILNPEIINSETLATLWSQDIPALLDTVQDCQEQSVYFLQERYE